ncbi:MAG TPA: helix-turn-helix transcriptional regulator [Bacillota bacterium]|nr:helix-turn-helix transcriptional regulator [Bacillota bacterium]
MRTPQVQLKEGTLDRLMAENDTNKTGLVVLTGVSTSQLYRIANGKSKVGVDFIARILSANPEKKFEDYFFVQ